MLSVYNKNYHHYRKRNISKNAFTFIELLIVIVIIGIILAISFPAWHSFTIRNKVIARVDAIANALQLARTDAIASGKSIKFCKSKDLRECCSNCTWGDGQIIIADNNKVMSVFGSLPAGDQLIWQSNFGNNDFLEFSPDGFLNGQRGSFYYCPNNAHKSIGEGYAMAIIIQNTGHIRVSNHTADGKTIPCM